MQIGRYLSDIDVGLGAYVSDFDEGFSGGAATEDLEVLFQLVHLAISEPLVEEVPFAQQQERYRDQLEFSTLDSTTAADAAFSDARTGGGRFAYQPTKAQINGLDADEALSIYQDRFGSLDDHVIVIVGDVDGDVVTELARSYIGTLPAQSATRHLTACWLPALLQPQPTSEMARPLARTDTSASGPQMKPRPTWYWLMLPQAT